MKHTTTNDVVAFIAGANFAGWLIAAVATQTIGYFYIGITTSVAAAGLTFVLHRSK